MKYLKTICIGLLVAFVSVTTASAWHLTGRVQCPNGAVLKDVVINVTGTSCEGAFNDQAVTDGDGFYILALPDCDGSFTASVDLTSLPAGATVISPAGGTASFTTSDVDPSEEVDWEIDTAICAEARCWFTGGGTKIDPLINIPVAQKGKWVSFGGNVNPGCSPTAGDGGNWNHVDRLLNVHFQGRAIQVLNCGNVTPPPPPGSTSPKTPFNFIEWTGTGTLKGIQGNKIGTLAVYFNARTEDRNEPGTKDSNAGSGVDRYYLHVFTNPANPAGSTVLLVNGDANPLNVVPVEIDTGNFQLHISSCDNPPTP